MQSNPSITGTLGKWSLNRGGRHVEIEGTTFLYLIIADCIIEIPDTIKINQENRNQTETETSDGPAIKFLDLLQYNTITQGLVNIIRRSLINWPL